MSKRFHAGGTIQRFQFDTPSQPANDFYALCSDERPLCLVFLRNFGHPITRSCILAYAQDHALLTDAALAVVVRSQPQSISANIPEGVVPFTIICDPEGVLFDYFAVPSVSAWKGGSLAARRILKEAKKQGFREAPGPQPLPVTLLVGTGGRVLWSHYGRTFTDLPENSEAVQRVAAGWLQMAAAEPAPQPEEPAPLHEAPASGAEAPIAPEPLEAPAAEGWETVIESSPAVEEPAAPEEPAAGPEPVPQAQPAAVLDEDGAFTVSLSAPEPGLAEAVEEEYELLPGQEQGLRTDYRDAAALLFGDD